MFAAYANANSGLQNPYTQSCKIKEDAADHKFLLVILKSGPSSVDYAIIYKLVRRHASGYFSNSDMVIYVRPNTLFVQYKNGESYGVDRRLGSCLVEKQKAPMV